MIDKLPEDILIKCSILLEVNDIYSLEIVLRQKLKYYDNFWKHRCKLIRGDNCRIDYYDIVKKLYNTHKCFRCDKYLDFGYIILLNNDKENKMILENYHVNCIKKNIKTLSPITTYISPLTDNLIMGFYTYGI